MPPVSEQVRRVREAPLPVKVAGAIVLALAAAIVAFILLFEWNWLRGPLANVISQRLHRPVQITGDLEVHPWSLKPRATVNGLVIGNAPWAGREPMAELPRLTVQVELLPLLRGRTILPLVQAERPNVRLVRNADGRANWDFGPRNASSEPLRLPAIRHFIIDEGRLRIDDAQRRVTFVGTVTSNERSTGSNRGTFQLVGEGTLNRTPFLARVTGAPLLNVSPDRPYPFRASVSAGATRIEATGSIPRPFDLGRFSTSLAVRGNDASDLYYLTGLAFPNTPPYQVRGAFQRNERRYDYRGFSGRVGDSDLAGDIHVDTGRDRPFLRAELASRRLDLDDLMAIVGGAPAVGRGETASPEQVAMARRLNAQGRLLPDARLATDRLRVMNADVRYRAGSVTSPRGMVRALSMHVTLENALLRVDPLSLTLPQGQLAGNIQINARQSTPITSADLRLTNARLEQFMPAGRAGDLSGGLYARAQLTGSGNSVRQAAATADGRFSVVIPRGRIREAFAELMGINATRGLFLLLSEDRDTAEIRCAVANFRASNGVLTADNIVFDTDVVASRGRGTINLRNETLNLRLEGRSKEFRLVRVMAPITLEGTFARPRPGVELGEAAGQVGIGALLGALLHPLAAVLPFVDPGLGEDANCSALVAGARAQGAPAPRR